LSPNEKFVAWVKERNGFYDNQIPRFIPIAKIAPHFLYIIDIIIRIKSVWVLGERLGGCDFPLDTEVPWDTAEITMSGKSSEMVGGVVECPIIRRNKDLYFNWSFYKIPLTPFAKGETQAQYFLDTTFVLH